MVCPDTLVDSKVVAAHPKKRLPFLLILGETGITPWWQNIVDGNQNHKEAAAAPTAAPTAAGGAKAIVEKYLDTLPLPLHQSKKKFVMQQLQLTRSTAIPTRLSLSFIQCSTVKPI